VRNLRKPLDGSAAKALKDAMALNLIKLCVGAESIDDLREWVTERSMLAIAAGMEPHSTHVTRMFPKRRDDILDGGSLYWVIKGQVKARQPILDIRETVGGDGITRAALVLGPEVVETVMQPKRPFQGWRYLESKDAPKDLGNAGSGLDDMPEHMKRELAELGLL
jgi:hypothetical protein